MPALSPLPWPVSADVLPPRCRCEVVSETFFLGNEAGLTDLALGGAKSFVAVLASGPTLAAVLVSGPALRFLALLLVPTLLACSSFDRAT